MKKQIRKKSFRGFTLLELAVTIATVAIVSAVAIPNFLRYPPKIRLNGATRVLASDLMSARIDAVKLKKRIYLEYTGSQAYQVAYLGKVLRSKSLKDEYQDVTISSNFGKIYFDSGGASTGTNTIQLENISGSKSITINLAGKVNIE